MTKAGEPLEWLMRHVDYQGNDCLAWPYSKRSDGRGYCWNGAGVRSRAHRLMCELAHGPSPAPKYEAAHSCGNGHLGCVNPRHLEWKTPKANQADRVIHGTASRGEKHGAAKLTDALVRSMRSEYQPRKVSFAKLARRYGVSTSVAERVVTGQSWKHIELRGSSVTSTPTEARAVASGAAA